MLALENVTAAYGHARILHGVTLTVEPGTVTALLGANGAGKTTLMRVAAGLLPASAGTIRLNGAPITGLRSSERVELGVALVPEGRLVFPSLSVAENMRLGGIARRARKTQADRAEQMYALFPRLAERSRQAAGTLSGGEQQMLAIARGLMSLPDILLLDEPTLGLAPTMCDMIFDTIARLCRDGLTVLIAEQNVPRALDLASTGYVMENGRIVMSGKSGALAQDPGVRTAYLGL